MFVKEEGVLGSYRKKESRIRKEVGEEIGKGKSDKVIQ